MADSGGSSTTRHTHTTTTDATSSQSNQGEEQPQLKDLLDKWQSLTEIPTKLTHTTDPQTSRSLRKATTLVHCLQNHYCSPNTTEKRLERIKRLLEKQGKQTAPKNPTGAAIAATPNHTASTFKPSLQRAAVRVRIKETKDKDAKDILIEAKKCIQGAYAIRKLRSGDIDVIVPDQATKDRVLNAPDITGVKISRQSYPVEVPGVPLSIQVENKRGEGVDSDLMLSIIREIRKTIPGLIIEWIRWLHDPEAQAKQIHPDEKVKKRGSLIINLPTQALQHQMVRHGVVIESQLFETRLYDHALQPKQCFRCNQWGHTQSACGKQENCGECAGAHATRNCPRKSVSCVNCGREHKSWQRKKCRTFQTYLQGVSSKRANLYARSASIRNDPAQKSMPTPSAAPQEMDVRKQHRNCHTPS